MHIYRLTVKYFTHTHMHSRYACLKLYFIARFTVISYTKYNHFYQLNMKYNYRLSIAMCSYQSTIATMCMHYAGTCIPIFVVMNPSQYNMQEKLQNTVFMNV